MSFACRSLTLLFCAAWFVAFPMSSPAQQPKDPYEVFARAFLDAIKKEDFKALRALQPSPAIYRRLSPQETAKLSNQQLSEKLARTVVPKLRNDFDNIRQDAAAREIAFARLRFVEIRHAPTEPPKEPTTAPTAANLGGFFVFYEYEGKTGSFAIAAAEVDGKVYLLEILRSVGVFRDVEK